MNAPAATVDAVEKILRERLSPAHVEIVDESARHAGHPGAAGGGGHYRLLIVAETFAGKAPLERHRIVYAALGDLMGKDVHALSIRAVTPEEYSELDVS